MIIAKEKKTQLQRKILFIIHYCIFQKNEFRQLSI